MALRDIRQVSQKQMSTSYADLLKSQLKLIDFLSLPLVILEAKAAISVLSFSLRPYTRARVVKNKKSKSERVGKKRVAKYKEQD